MRTGRALAVLSCAAVLATGCGSSSRATAGGDTLRAGVSGEVLVFAASSLKESFGSLAKKFEAGHPGVKVTLNFGASSALANTITQGAPADVFAAASTSTMKTVTTAGEASGAPHVFVRNQLQIAVPKGNPGHVTGLADFGNARLKIALCAVQVPCGAATTAAFAAAGVKPQPDTLEADAKATVAKVVLGEVDAALVYRTDVRAAGDAVQGIDFPEAAKAVNDYPIVVLKGARNAKAAKSFVDFVQSADGRSVLRAAGFALP